jgi:uncharacterized protein YejL (UPF0352 family)
MPISLEEEVLAGQLSSNINSSNEAVSAAKEAASNGNLIDSVSFVDVDGIVTPIYGFTLDSETTTAVLEAIIADLQKQITGWEIQLLSLGNSIGNNLIELGVQSITQQVVSSAAQSGNSNTVTAPVTSVTAAQLEAIIPNLPTEMPITAGVLWNNNGVLSIS